MTIRRRRAMLLAKIQTVPGTAESLSASADAVKIEDFDAVPDVNLVDTNEVSGSIDKSAPLVAGMKAKITFSVLLKGSGTGATPPEAGKLLRACSFEEVITATAVPASAEACAAGTTISATLAAGASATAQAYRGMPITISGAVTDANGTYLISDYSAGKVATLAALAGDAIDNTSDYQIPVNVLYRPTSDESVMKILTLGAYRDGKRQLFTDVRGTVSFSIEAGGIGRASFEMMGLFAGEADVALPSSPVYQTTLPPIWKAGRFLIDRARAAVAQFSFAANASPVMPGDPNEAEGFGAPIITERDMGGDMDPLDELVATNDTMTDFRSGTQKILLAQMGSSAGNRIAITIPSAQYRSLRDTARDGLNARQLGYKANGIDAGGFIAFW
ncbi:MAG: hypothetical protein GC202_02065 [Alphaproteobacteria bacterium]|nr:hypothetical protein [Alphaproteobacteria bacterium]